MTKTNTLAYHNEAKSSNSTGSLKLKIKN